MIFEATTSALASEMTSPAATGLSLMPSTYPSINRPSLSRGTCEGTNVHNREKMAGNFRANSARKCPAFEITHGDYLKLVQDRMRQFAGHGPEAAKKISQVIECSPKTARSWLDGETAPSGILDLRAMNKIPAYAALKNEIAAMESNLDPRLQAKYHELHRLTLELAGDP